MTYLFLPKYPGDHRQWISCAAKPWAVAWITASDCENMIR
eukprot:CAMPEP_0174360384 /NCGR_PEP_ID=MMETSP0811_2-20130205/53906_1 /TAXON_ID=73025 ORGANISM="Eutreptiella gymnastica-like, Strain CCMP1594" /NCGR_SAMPLE_ID=MMETSP0811_2 /ASSEMBLY_ACC=CAM_ASM_000667 /LENGTH=39 /DNA_ID= /DNA_START= /DNA_END= /DNA_ORIENTATION=